MVVLRLVVDQQHKPADDSAVLADPVGDTVVDAVLDGLAGNDLAVLFKVVIPLPEFLQRTVLERALVVEDELLPVIVREKGECDL